MMKTEMSTEKSTEQKVQKAARKKPEKKEVKKRTHVVVEGDTIRSISKRYYGSTSKMDSIRKLNNLATDSLRVGRELLLP